MPHKNLKPHALAELFPMMDDSDIQILADDIKVHGQRAPINLFEGKILDGRNRYAACKLAGTAPIIRDYPGDDALDFVLSANLHRRHLTESQRALVAAKLANMKQGEKSEAPGLKASIEAGDETSQREAAKRLNVSRSSVQRAKKLIESAPKSVVDAVRDGSETVHGALQNLKQKEGSESPDELFDETGLPVPKEIHEEWLRAKGVGREAMRKISEVKCVVERGLEDKDPIFVELNNGLIADLKHAHYTISLIVPHAVCPKCQGKAMKKCLMCKGRGWVSKFRWKNTISEEERLLRGKQVEGLKK